MAAKQGLLGSPKPAKKRYPHHEKRQARQRKTGATDREMVDALRMIAFEYDPIPQRKTYK